MSNRYTYEIDDDNVVSIFDSERPTENGAPNILQPYPPGDVNGKFTEEEARAWAESVIEGLINPAQVVDAEIVEETPAE